MGPRPTIALVALAALLLSLPERAQADVLVFVNGRTLTVTSHRADDRTITVTLARGGEATFDRSVVADVIRDESPVNEPGAAPAPVADEGDAVGEEPATPAPDAQPVLFTLPAVEDLSARPFASLIAGVAARHGIHPALVHAVVQAESNYQPRARSRAGARGLMQVLPSTARDLGIGNLYDPLNNLEAGVQYLKLLLTRFDLTHALAAYNAGPAAVVRHQGVPPFPETQRYVDAVVANLLVPVR